MGTGHHGWRTPSHGPETEVPFPRALPRSAAARRVPPSGAAPLPAGGSAAKPAQDPRRKSIQASAAQSIPLSHAGDNGEKDACNTEGPYDVVLMDMTLSRLLHALLQAPLPLPLCVQMSKPSTVRLT